ncbi:hypothetical protein I316_01410 [Kwoniella heveanensis BCC8398]|uniref:Spermidine synthase n=1 Tax=Kwoniella heveanensis BCC8398 TaxID=1296120 RepID=A0A1B9H0N7_9TREE|nr:hypothetical protein I316_01410 [Kwoniella heveanensis BCC8398]
MSRAPLSPAQPGSETFRSSEQPIITVKSQTRAEPANLHPHPPPKRQDTLISEVSTSPPITNTPAQQLQNSTKTRTATDPSDSSDSSASNNEDEDNSEGDSELSTDSDSQGESDTDSYPSRATHSDSDESANSESQGGASEREGLISADKADLTRTRQSAPIDQVTHAREAAGRTKREIVATTSSDEISKSGSEDLSESGAESEGESGSDESEQTDTSGRSGTDSGSSAPDSDTDSVSGSGSDSEAGNTTRKDSKKQRTTVKANKGVRPEKIHDHTHIRDAVIDPTPDNTHSADDQHNSTRIRIELEGTEVEGQRTTKVKGKGHHRAKREAEETKNQGAEKEEGEHPNHTQERRKGRSSRTERETREAYPGDSERGARSAPVRIPTQRNMQQNMIRYASLYLVPVLLSIPISLLLSLNVSLLTPLYNTTPLTLHKPEIYAFYLIPPSAVYWYITLSASAKDRISARVCFSIAALSGDAVAVCGRRVGSMMGQMSGPEWGAVTARAVLGAGVVGGGVGFALMCFDHISAIPPASNISDRPRNMGSILYRGAFFLAHVYVGEHFWTSHLSGNVNMLNASPEKTILFISLLLTLLSLFLRPGNSSIPFSTRVHNLITTSLGLSPKASKALSRLTTQLPRQAFPILLLLRVPLLILALRQQIFLRPPSSRPYITANGDLRVISSERSLTGQIVVAENLKDGYRFLRADHSILGGRWIREVSDKSAVGGKRTEMGDSIFATFNLQEVAVLAQRSDASESLAKTLSLTTDLEVTLEGENEEEGEKVPDRALVIGLGAGIAASSFAKREMYVDVVEIDPAVYLAAQKHFELPHDHLASTNILDGASFLSQLADMKRNIMLSLNDTDEDNNESETAAAQLDMIPTWDIVVQDCFTGGSVPGEMFTLEFWNDTAELMKEDGIMAMNFAGVLKSRASKAVLVTLLTVFPQCRAFGDGFEKDQGPSDLVNMVVFCTKAHSPLLTFRKPTRQDALRSPLRAHVYSTFHPHEIQLDSIVSEADFQDPELTLRRGNGQAQKDMDRWQVGSGMATWRAMQKILSPEMWLAY